MRPDSDLAVTDPLLVASAENLSNFKCRISNSELLSFGIREAIADLTAELSDGMVRLEGYDFCA